MRSPITACIVDVQRLPAEDTVLHCKKRVQSGLTQFLSREANYGLDGRGTLRRAIHAGRVLVDPSQPASSFAGDVVHENVRSEARKIWKDGVKVWTGIDSPDPPQPMLSVDCDGNLITLCDFAAGDKIITVAGLLLPRGVEPPPEHHAFMTFAPVWSPYSLHLGDLSPCNFSRFLGRTSIAALANIHMATLSNDLLVKGTLLVIIATRAILAGEPLLLRRR